MLCCLYKWFYKKCPKNHVFAKHKKKQRPIHSTSDKTVVKVSTVVFYFLILHLSIFLLF